MVSRLKAPQYQTTGEKHSGILASIASDTIESVGSFLPSSAVFVITVHKSLGLKHHNGHKYTMNCNYTRMLIAIKRYIQ